MNKRIKFNMDPDSDEVATVEEVDFEDDISDLVGPGYTDEDLTDMLPPDGELNFS